MNIIKDVLEYVQNDKEELQKIIDELQNIYNSIEEDEEEEKADYLEEKLQVCGYSKDDLYELEYLKRG